MIVILHRINTIKIIMNNPKGYEVKIDLRSFKHRLSLNYIFKC